MTDIANIEVLDVRLSRADARGLITTAKRHWKTGVRAALLFSAELRQLQDGEAHLAYGYNNFAEWAEYEFDGLTAATAKAAVRQGAALLALQRNGRIALGEVRSIPVGTTGARELASILGKYGEPTMLAVYDRAVAAQPDGRALSDVAIRRVERALLEPPKPTQAAPVQEAAPEAMAYVSDEDEPYDPIELPGEMRQLRLSLDDMLDSIVHVAPSEADRVAVLREAVAIRARLDRLTASLSRPREA
ncbi:MAG: hypothetical protein ACLP0J_03900 [Solirubrobacteraceae bacterium]